MTRRSSLLHVVHALGTALLLTATTAVGGAQYAVPQSADEVPRTSMEAFKTMVDEGSVVALDVRSLADYRLGHVPGARSMPLNDVPARAEELRSLGKPIVAYCT